MNNERNESKTHLSEKVKEFWETKKKNNETDRGNRVDMWPRARSRFPVPVSVPGLPVRTIDTGPDRVFSGGPTKAGPVAPDTGPTPVDAPVDRSM